MLHRVYMGAAQQALRVGAIAIFAVAAFGQVTTTGIHGVVRDPSNSVVPNAVVKALDTGTGIERSTTAARDGGFVFASLQAATYKLTVTASGFQTLGGFAIGIGRQHLQ